MDSRADVLIARVTDLTCHRQCQIWFAARRKPHRGKIAVAEEPRWTNCHDCLLLALAQPAECLRLLDGEHALAKAMIDVDQGIPL